MAKSSRKKQRIEQEKPVTQPLGVLNIGNEDAEKDDEERRLESLLFGKTFSPRDKDGKENVLVVSDDEGDALDGEGNGFGHLQDDDVCCFRVEIYFIY